MEWLCLILPFISAFCLKFFFHKEIVWWEIIIPILPPLFLIPTVKITSEIILTNDKERWGSYIVNAYYYEDWNEYIYKKCTKTISCGKDCIKTKTYDCSYVSYHSPKWIAKDNLGRSHDINEFEYQRLVDKFGNEEFHDMHRWHYTNDGDMYQTNWDGQHSKLQPYFTEHIYKNRIQASNNIFKFPKVENIKDLFDYPPLLDNFNDPAILGNHPHKYNADKLLQKYNALLGKDKQIHIWILLFKNKPRKIAFDQEAYWQGGNKNEFVVCIGLDNDNKVLWNNNFCWNPDGNTSNDVIKIELRDYIEKQKELNLVDTVEKIVELIKLKFVRKQFKEFSYISVPTPTWAIITCFILTTISTIGVGFFVINNDFKEDYVRY